MDLKIKNCFIKQECFSFKWVLVVSLVLMNVFMNVSSSNADYLTEDESTELTTDYVPVTQTSTTNSVQMTIIKAKVGTQITLDCSFDDVDEKMYEKDQIDTFGNKNANLKILWLKENKGVISMNGEIKLNKQKYSSFSPNTQTLHLLVNNVQLEDNGKYICQHFDYAIIKPFQLIVLVPPSNPQISYKINYQSSFQLIDDLQRMVNVYENDFVQINCYTKYSGHPMATYKWYRNDEEITNRHNTTNLNVINGLLYIRNINYTNHLDQYTCALSNEALDEPLKITIQLNVFFKPYVYMYFNSSQYLRSSSISTATSLYSSPYYTFNNSISELHIRNHKTIENASEVIFCVVKANPKPLKIEWYKDDILLPDVNDYAYEIAEVNINDKGLYRCKIHNTLGYGQFEVELDVQYKPRLYMNTLYEIVEGQNINITCDVDSNPRFSNFSWFINTERIDFTIPDSIDDFDDYQIQRFTTRFSDFNIFVESDRITLELTNAKSNYNNANFKCIVSNNIYLRDTSEVKEFLNEASTLLNVLYKPIIETTVSKKAVEINTTAELKCMLRSNPFSNIYWMFNDTILRQIVDLYEQPLIKIDQNIISYENMTQMSVLTLNNVQHKQLGWYKCIVNNTVGSSSHDTYLMLATIPDTPTHFVVINKTYSSVHLQWQPEFDGGSEQIFVLSINGLQEIESTANHLFLKDLEEAVTYEFKIKSRNKFGYSTWSPPIIATTSYYPYSAKDIKLNIIRVEKLDNELKIILSNENKNSTTNTTTIATTIATTTKTQTNNNNHYNKNIRYVLKLQAKLIDSYEYYNISENQTSVSIIYDGKTTELNASICILIKDNRTVCGKTKYIDLINLRNKDYESYDTSKLSNGMPIDLLSLMRKRFKLLIIIILTTMSLLVIMVSVIYFIYTFMVKNTTNGADKKKKSKKSNSTDAINNSSSPISAYMENTNNSSNNNNEFEIPISLDNNNTSCNNNNNNSSLLLFNSTRILPIPEVNEDLIKDDEEIRQQQQQIQRQAPNDTNLTNTIISFSQITTTTTTTNAASESFNSSASSSSSSAGVGVVTDNIDNQQQPEQDQLETNNNNNTNKASNNNNDDNDTNNIINFMNINSNNSNKANKKPFKHFNKHNSKQ